MDKCEQGILNSGAVDRYHIKQQKYYVEIWDINREGGDTPYLMQSQWYDTIDECYKFVSLFDYVDSDLRFSLMTAKFTNEYQYGDIDCIESDMELKLSNNNANSFLNIMRRGE